MYELVERKNNNRKVLIWGGLLIFAGALFLEIREGMRPHIDEKLVKAANEINSHTPIIIDSFTRLDNVIAMTGKVLQYNYTLLHTGSDQVDTTWLINTSRASLKNRMRTSPEAAGFRKYEIELRVNYSDSNGNHICRFTISPGGY